MLVDARGQRMARMLRVYRAATVTHGKVQSPENAGICTLLEYVLLYFKYIFI